MNPLSLLTSTIRRVAAKVRAYLAQPLETQLWRLHQDIASKLGPVSLDFTNNDSIPEGNFLCDQRLTASLLIELLQQVQVFKSYWSSCDVILACPFTIDSARATFGEDKCVCLRNSDDHDNVINAFSVGTVGVLSPWLLKRLLQSTDGPYLLLRACRELLCIVPAGRTRDEIYTRKVLHEVGFYEVSRLQHSGAEDLLSVGCLPDGSFRLFSSTAGFVEGLFPWKTLKASRLPRPLEKHLLWSSVLLEPLVETHLGFVAANGGTGLMVTDLPASKDGNFIISGTICWETPDSSHASLVACYRGPADSSMVCATVQVLNNSIAIISILVHDDVWSTLASTQIPQSLIQTSEQGLKEVETWLDVSETHIQAGCNGQTLIQLNTHKLKLAPVGGVRVSGEGVGISHLSFSKCEIHQRRPDLKGLQLESQQEKHRLG